jgi:uncharacterized RDD family membrane protein YckC
VSSAKPNLASWERRLLAAVLDAMALFVMLLILFALVDTLGLSSMLVAAAMPVAYVAYNSAGLLAPQFSFGRMVAGISVVSVRGNGEITRMQALARPIVRVLAIALALVVGIVIDQPWFLMLPLVTELALIVHTPWRQSIADLIAGTIVVVTPQPQPHRAPAFPMYSATDTEFGPPPRRKKPGSSIGRVIPDTTV